MAIKGVLFDLDNTLIDFMKMKLACSHAAVDAMIAAGLRMKADVAFKKLMSVYWEVGIEYDYIFQEFLKKVGKIDYKILSAGIIAYRRTRLSMIRPYAGVVPTLIFLKQKGLKLGVVTDAPRLKAWLRLTELGVTDFFDAVVAFEDTGKKKPSSLPFSKALKKLKLKPSETLMVGDWPERDILGAKRLGMRTCFARYGWQWPKKIPMKGKSGADHEIERIEELRKII